MFTKENITLFIVIGGAFLSTYKLISDYRKNIRKIKVQVSYGFISTGRSIGPDVITINAINMGYRDVTLTSVEFILPNNYHLIILDPQDSVKLPHTLPEGKSCYIWKESQNLAQQLKEHGFSAKIKLIGYYGSATGKVFKSKPIDFNTESY